MALKCENILRDREFAQVVSNHLWLNFDLVELLSWVDTNDASNHFWNNDHVSEVSLDEIWLLVWLGLLLCLTELLDQTHRLALKTTVEATTGTSVNDIAKLVGGEVQESEWENIGLAKLLPFEFIYAGIRAAYWSRSIPRYENLRKVLFFLISAASSAFCDSNTC